MVVYFAMVENNTARIFSGLKQFVARIMYNTERQKTGRSGDRQFSDLSFFMVCPVYQLAGDLSLEIA